MPTLPISAAAFDGYELPLALGEIARIGARTVELACIKGIAREVASQFESPQRAVTRSASSHRPSEGHVPPCLGDREHVSGGVQADLEAEQAGRHALDQAPAPDRPWLDTR